MKRKFLLLLLIILISAQLSESYAAEKKSEVKETIKSVPDCGAQETEIRNDIEKLGECWKSEDCTYRYFGCPWDKEVCWFTIVGVEEDSKKLAEVDQKIVKYDRECVRTNKELSAKCDQYYSLARKAECPEHEPFICLDGRCVTQSALLLKGGPEPGKDYYGSRSVSLIKKGELDEPKKPEGQDEKKDSTDR